MSGTTLPKSPAKTRPSKPKEYLAFPDGVWRPEAAFTPERKFAVHRPQGSKQDWIVTHVASFEAVLRFRLKGEATSAARALEILWVKLPAERLDWLIAALRESI